MKEKLKRLSLGLCLFVFLFVVVGGGFHLNPGGAFVAALSGTPLVICVFNRWTSATQQPERRQQGALPVEFRTGRAMRSFNVGSKAGHFD
jgi:hypothetical protein